MALNIVKGLFGVDFMDLVPGLRSAAMPKKEWEGGMLPSLQTEMFIGREGLGNLERSGVNIGNAMENMDAVASDWLKLKPEEFDEKWGKSGFLVDPVNGKPMYEISDKEVTIKPGLDLKALPNDEYLTLDEVFNMPTLKKAYPGIEDIKIGFDIDDPKSARLAAFDPANNAILFNRQHPDWKKYDPVKTVLHEAQHYVQGRELFTKGAGFVDMLKGDDDYLEAFSELVPAVNPKSSAYKVNTKQAIADFVAQNPNMGFSTDELAVAIERLGREDGLSAFESLKKSIGEDKAAKLIAFGQGIPQIDAVLTAKETASKEYNRVFSEYLKVAGEVFARQTEQRAGMSTPERRAESIYRTIDTDPINRKYGVRTDNMIASPPMPMQEQVASPFESTIQSSIPQGL